MNANKYDFPSVGCYIDESAGSATDLMERVIDFAGDYGFTISEPLPDRQTDDFDEALYEEADSAVDFLNDLETRDFMYWTIDDNSLFLTVDVDGAQEDEDVYKGEPGADYNGLWLDVNDHGNATLCYRDETGADNEIWAIV